MNDKSVVKDDWGDDSSPEVIEAIKQHMDENYAPGVHIPWEALEANIVPEAKILYGALYGFSDFETPDGCLVEDSDLSYWSSIAKGKIPKLLNILIKKKLIIFMRWEELEDGGKARRIKKGVIDNE